MFACSPVDSFTCMCDSGIPESDETVEEEGQSQIEVQLCIFIFLYVLFNSVLITIILLVFQLIQMTAMGKLL